MPIFFCGTDVHMYGGCIPLNALWLPSLLGAVFRPLLGIRLFRTAKGSSSVSCTLCRAGQTAFPFPLNTDHGLSTGMVWFPTGIPCGTVLPLHCCHPPAPFWPPFAPPFPLALSPPLPLAPPPLPPDGVGPSTQGGVPGALLQKGTVAIGNPWPQT